MYVDDDKPGLTWQCHFCTETIISGKREYPYIKLTLANGSENGQKIRICLKCLDNCTVKDKV